MLAVKLPLVFFALLFGACAATAPPISPARQVEKVKPLPIALDSAFTFRKTKQYFLDPLRRGLTGGAPVDASILFERDYHLFGAITALDQRQRYGNYYTFFWRAKRRADITVRLEYRQENLHAFTQAREVQYRNIRGNHETKFAIIGDDFFDDGRVIAWRASLIVNGQIVAVDRSYLWD